MNKTKLDAIIVGAGISDLLMAMVLSKEGKKVLIIEKINFWRFAGNREEDRI